MITSDAMSEPKHRCNYLTTSERFKLDIFASVVWDHFGSPPYLVGSSLHTKDFRDVDVRLILDDDELAKFAGAREAPNRNYGCWSAIGMAFSALGRELTGLPIDFQLQRMDEANEQFDGERRHTIGLTVNRRFGDIGE